MSRLRMTEKNLVDELTGMSSGYVFDFTNATFAEFFRTEVGIDIYDDAYNLESGSKGKRLRAFLERGQPAAISKALTALWEYREDLRRREGKPEHIPDARRRVSNIIERLSGSPLPLSYDEVPPQAPPKPASNGPNATVLQALTDDFFALHNMPAHRRGFAFEAFLTNVFDVWHLDARAGFRNAGEQIDGSFWHGGDTYLVEAKWHKEATGAATLHAFQGKVSERHDWTRGLFVSYAGFTDDGLQAFTARRVILMDGDDLKQMLMRGLPLGQVIDAKVRHAAESKQAFARVVYLFPV